MVENQLKKLTENGCELGTCFDPTDLIDLSALGSLAEKPLEKERGAAGLMVENQLKKLGMQGQGHQHLPSQATEICKFELLRNGKL